MDEKKDRACPCLYVEPCHPYCTCVSHGMSTGCKRCCTYGSFEQRTAKAKFLVACLDEGYEVAIAKIKASQEGKIKNGN